jgi:hypothetical protein
MEFVVVVVVVFLSGPLWHMSTSLKDWALIKIINVVVCMPGDEHKEVYWSKERQKGTVCVTSFSGLDLVQYVHISICSCGVVLKNIYSMSDLLCLLLLMVHFSGM